MLPDRRTWAEHDRVFDISLARWILTDHKPSSKFGPSTKSSTSLHRPTHTRRSFPNEVCSWCQRDPSSSSFITPSDSFHLSSDQTHPEIRDPSTINRSTKIVDQTHRPHTCWPSVHHQRRKYNYLSASYSFFRNMKFNYVRSCWFNEHWDVNTF